MFTSAEQFQLERINRARLDPLSEAARLGIDLDQGLPAGTLDGGARQPLAPNALLTLAAEKHSQWMLAADVFSHTGAGGSGILDRILAEGYTAQAPRMLVGENLAWSGTTGTIDLNAAIAEHHDGLFLSPGHRRNLLNGEFREIGIAQERGTFAPDGTPYDASVLTNKFGVTGTALFLTGVAFDDADGDGLYSIGEGVAGVRFAIDGPGVLTASAGGYGQVLASTAGSVTVTVTRGETVLRAAVEVAGGNVKLDLMDGVRLLSSASLTLLEGAGEAALLGVADLTLTGNDAGNLLIGNAGDNILTGGAGDDVLQGGRGDDVLFGGGGRNTAVFSAAAAQYAVTEEGDAVVVADLRDGADSEGVNRLHDIHVLRFADGDVVLVPEPGGVTVAGRVVDRSGQEIAGAAVTFTPEAGAAREAVSGADGAFALDLDAGAAGRLDLALGWSAGAPAVTTASALEALRLAVGLTPSWGEARAEDYIAADFDGDGRVTAADALGILRSAVGLSGAHSPRWVFVDAADPLDGIARDAVSYEQGLVFAGLEADHGVELTGILVGQLLAFT